MKKTLGILMASMAAVAAMAAATRPGFGPETDVTQGLKTNETKGGWYRDITDGFLPVNAAASPYNCVGDGETDVSTELQSALAAGSGKTVYIPPGVYVVSGLVVPPNTRVISDSATLKLRDGANTGIMWCGEGVTVEGVAFDGNKANQTGYGDLDYRTMSAITVSNRCVIRDVSVVDAYGSAVYGAAVSGVVLDWLTISGCQGDEELNAGAASAIFLTVGSGKSVIKNCRISGCERSGIKVLGYEPPMSAKGETIAAHVDVTRNTIDYSDVVTFPTSTLFPTTVGHPNRYLNTSILGIELWGVTANSSVNENRIIGPLASWVHQIDVDTDSFTSTNHPFSNGDQVYVFSQAAPVGVSPGTLYYVVGAAMNTFQLSLLEGGAALDILGDGTYPIRVGRPRIMPISFSECVGCLGQGNQVIGNSFIGIELNSCAEMNISGNRIEDAGWGVYDSAQVANGRAYTIVDNDIIGSYAAAIELRGGRGHKIKGNTLRDSHRGDHYPPFAYAALINLSNVVDSTIADNTFEAKDHYVSGVLPRYRYALQAINSTNLTLIGNSGYIVSGGNQASNYFGVAVLTNCHDWTWTANRFSGMNPNGEIYTPVAINVLTNGVDVLAGHRFIAESWNGYASYVLDCARFAPLLFNSAGYKNAGNGYANIDLKDSRITEDAIRAPFVVTTNIHIGNEAGFNRDIQWNTGTTRRWTARVNNTAETGDDAGSDWSLSASRDDGSGLGFASLFAKRATGAVGVWTSNPGYPLDVGGSARFGALDTNITVRINGSTNTIRSIQFETAQLPRWDIRANNANETNHTGCDFQVLRYNDAGVYQSTPVSIDRSSGITTFAHPIVVAGGSEDPTSLAPGMVWLRSDLGQMRATLDGTNVVVLSATAP